MWLIGCFYIIKQEGENQGAEEKESEIKRRKAKETSWRSKEDRGQGKGNAVIQEKYEK